MKLILFSVAAMFLANSALAEISGSPEEAEAIKSSVSQRHSDQNFVNMWQRGQQNSLKKSLLESPKTLSSPFLNASEFKEKCFPWMWEGGQRQRLAVATAAQLCLRAELDANTGAQQAASSIDALGDAELYAFNQQFQLARVRAEGRMPLQGAATAEADVSVLNKQVWSDSVTAPEVQWSKSFRLLNLDKTKTTSFLIGPVPASVTVGARGTIDAKFSARITIGNTEAAAIPTVKVDGYAFGGIDLQLVKGGVESDINLVDERMNIYGRVGLLIDPTTTPPQLLYAAEAAGNNNISALKGRVDLVAKTKFQIPGLGKQFRYPIFQNEGFSASGYMFKETIAPTPVTF
jgi:hypothetical protein